MLKLFPTGDTTNESVALMEDSLMILGSLLSNRCSKHLLALITSSETLSKAIVCDAAIREFYKTLYILYRM